MSTCPTTCEADEEAAGDGLFGAADLSQKRLLARNVRFLVASAACMATGAVIDVFLHGQPWPTVVEAVGLTGLALGYPMYWLAIKTVLFARRKLTTEVFITLALVAVVYVGKYWYASWVVFIMWVGETLMAWAGQHARSGVEELMRLMPRQARVSSGGTQRLIPIEDLAVGDVVIVHPGERISVDGTIVHGDTAVDEAVITGEAIPVDRGPGEEVFAGTFNLQGAIRVRTTRAVAENTVARIVALMRQAQTDRLPVQRTVDRFLTWFLPLVIVAAALAGILSGSLERAATILLVITPCAFSASTPLALIATIGNAARRGIVIKGGSCIEACSRATVVLLDKTGTLTASTPDLSVVEVTDGASEAEVLRLAAIAERPSSHPLAHSVVRAAQARGIHIPDPDSFEVASGHGITARWSGRTVAVGNQRFIHAANLAIPPDLSEAAARREAEGHTLAFVVVDGTVVGLLGFSAAARPDAPAVVAGLRRLGVRQLVMLTGDRSAPAARVARQLGVDYRAEATPEAKQAEVRRWREGGATVVMVGDGINDAGALAAADVGIAMVAAGAEVAASAADVIVHGDDIASVLATARLARRGVWAIRVNIFFATGYNIVGLSLALSGVIPLGVAVLFQAASFISVVVNSALVLRYNPRVPTAGRTRRPREEHEPAAPAAA